MRLCSICKKPVAPKPENRAFPFCSERCKLIDLGHWLGEDYRVAGKPEEEEDDERPEADGQPKADDDA